MVEVKHTVVTLGGDYCNLKDYIKQLQDIYDGVEEKFRDKVKIDVSAYEDYGSASVEIDIYYNREENAAEKAARLKREAGVKEGELKQYIALKKKYEGTIEL